MKRNALTYLLLPFLLALLVTACKDDTLPASPAEEEEAGSGVYVSVVVNTGGSNASRVPTPGENGDLPKQPGTGDENMVHDLNVFFFQGESTGKRLGINSPNAANIPVHSLYFSSEDLHYMGPDASNNYDAVYSVTKEVSEIGLLVGQTYDVLVIANIDYDPIKSPFEINNLSDLQKANFYDVMVHIENEKKFAMAFACAILAAGMMTGCGDVDENKTPDQIKAEVAKLDAAAIQKQIDAYKKAIEEKSKELSKVMDQIKEIPLTEQLSDNAKKLQAEAANLGKSINKLKDNLEAYVDGLKEKAGE